jgi:hypothetical protein
MRTICQLEEDIESMKIFENMLSEEDLDLLLATRKLVSNVRLGCLKFEITSSLEPYKTASFWICDRPHDTL